MASGQPSATDFEQTNTKPENDKTDKVQNAGTHDIISKKTSDKTAAERLKHPPSFQETEGFPVDSENPFEQPCLGSDLVLVVEGKRLHVHRTLLVLHSPVFHRMLTADMKEKNQEEIELPDRQHDAMVKFLLQMYPVHSLKNLKDDVDLTDILPLADFFQADHARLKCQNYIQFQTQQKSPEQLSRQSKMLYVFLCETYRLDSALLASALETAATLPLQAVLDSTYYPQLQDATKVGLLERRCRLSEKAEACERERGAEGRRVVSAFCIKSRASRLDERCPSCRWVSWYCERCVRREVAELKEQFK